jgi:aspartate kinase
MVGEDLRYRPGIVGRAFAALEDVNIRMISQGASLLNCSFVIAETDLETVVSRLHNVFFEQLDPKVFAA